MTHEASEGDGRIDRNTDTWAAGEQPPLIVLSHATDDAAVADQIAEALAERGFEVARRAGATPLDAALLNEAKAFVLILSEAAHRSQTVREDMAVPIAKDIPIYPVRVDETELKGYLGYYLQIAQWIDLDPVDPHATLDDLAAALTGGLAERGGYADGRRGGLLRRHPVAAALAAALVCALALTAWLWGGRLITAIDATRFDTAGYNVFFTVTEEGGHLLARPQQLFIALQGLPRYDLPLRADFYDAPPGGPVRKLGQTEETPETMEGAGVVQMLVAEAPADPALCLIFPLEDGGRARALVRPDPEIPGAMTLDAERLEDGTCDTLMGDAVDDGPLEAVRRTEHLLQIEETQTFETVQRVDSNGSRTWVRTYERGRPRAMRFDSHVTIYGGTGPDDLAPLAAGPVVHGPVPPLLRVCVETRVAVDDWPLVTHVVDYHVASGTLRDSKLSLEAESICRALAGEGAVFPEDVAPALLERALPQGSGGRFNAPDGPSLAGIRLGMGFEAARAAMTEALPFGLEVEMDPDQIDSFPRQFMGLREPERTLGGGRRTTLEDAGLGMRLSVIADPRTDVVVGVWAVWRPPPAAADAALLEVRPDIYRQALRAAYGDPKAQASEYFVDFFSMVWSRGAGAPCRDEESGSGDEGFSLRPRHTVCQAHLVAQVVVRAGAPVYSMRLLETPR